MEDGDGLPVRKKSPVIPSIVAASLTSSPESETVGLLTEAPMLIE